MSRSKESVRLFNDGGFIVRGTQDRSEALRIFFEDNESSEHYQWEEIGWGVYRPEYELPEDHPHHRSKHEPMLINGKLVEQEDTPQPDPELVQNFGDRLHEMLGTRDTRAGWFRWVPASAWDRENGTAQWLSECKGPGRGIFAGVAFYE